MSPASEENAKKLGELQESVKKQWDWVGTATAPAMQVIREFRATDEDNWLRQKVRSTRLAVESAYGTAKGFLNSGAGSISASSDGFGVYVEDAKTRALEIRRQNPQLVVAGVTVLAIAPAYRSGFRALLRNAVIGGGTAAFFLYPEFVARTAPYVDRASTDLSKHASKAAERMGLLKNDK